MVRCTFCQCVVRNTLSSVVILGSNRAGVMSARTRIDVLTTSARRRLPFTHFLSLPILSDTVREKFDIFKEEVLQECARVSQHCIYAAVLHRVRKKNGTTSILGITLTKFNKFL